MLEQLPTELWDGRPRRDDEGIMIVPLLERLSAERMPDDDLTRRLFAAFLEAATQRQVQQAAKRSLPHGVQ